MSVIFSQPGVLHLPWLETLGRFSNSLCQVSLVFNIIVPLMVMMIKIMVKMMMISVGDSNDDFLSVIPTVMISLFRLDFKQPGEKILANVRQIVKNSEVAINSDDNDDYNDNDHHDDNNNNDDYDGNDNENDKNIRVFLQVVMFLVMMMFAGVFWGFIEVAINFLSLKILITISATDMSLISIQAFLFWFLDDLGAKKLDMGWTVKL